MKRLGFIFGVFLFGLFPQMVHAQYSISASGLIQTISGTAYRQSTTENLSVLIRTDDIGGAINTIANTTQPGFVKVEQLSFAQNSTIAIFAIANLEGDKTYYLDLIETATKKILAKTSATTQKQDPLFYQWPLEALANKGKVILKGKIDTSKYSQADLNAARVTIYTAPIGQPFKEGDDPESNPSKKIWPVSPPNNPNQVGGVDGSTGEYIVTIDGLTPGQRYSYAQKIVLGNRSEVKVNEFDSNKGHLTVAQEQNDVEKRSYRLLAPLPGLAVLFDPDLCLELIAKNQVPEGSICTKEDPSGLNGFINYFVKLLVGLAAVFLVIRIIMEGWTYIVTDTPLKKASAKSKLWEAVGGLVVALSAWIILNTINPKLVANNVSIQTLNLSVEDFGENDTDVVLNVPGASFAKSNFPSGVSCPETGGRSAIRNIAASWQGKVTYSQSKRGTKGPDSTFYLDCSSYVATVLQCAGVQPPLKPSAITTKSIFEQMPGAEKVTDTDFSQSGDKIFVKGKELLPGDLVGWRTSGKGHVLIYVGNGKFRESQVGGTVQKNPILGTTGNSVQQEKDLSRILKEIKKTSVTGYIRRV